MREFVAFVCAIGLVMAAGGMLDRRDREAAFKAEYATLAARMISEAQLQADEANLKGRNIDPNQFRQAMAPLIERHRELQTHEEKGSWPNGPRLDVRGTTVATALLMIGCFLLFFMAATGRVGRWVGGSVWKSINGARAVIESRRH